MTRLPSRSRRLAGSASRWPGRRVAAAAALSTLAWVAVPIQTHAQTTFVVESPTMTAGAMMPRDYSPDGRNVSPPLVWSGLPAGTRQLAVICQDHGAGNPPPWVHWIIYNIPGTATGLPEGIPFDASEPMPPGLEGAAQGLNGWGLPMYRGPAPPGESLHHYHFVVYALDEELDLPPGLDREELLEAIEGHVLGQGSMTPHYRRHPAPEGPVE